MIIRLIADADYDGGCSRLIGTKPELLVGEIVLAILMHYIETMAVAVLPMLRCGAERFR